MAKSNIHPESGPIVFSCSCGHQLNTRSTLGKQTGDKEMNIEVCSNCHPFYTGKDKLVDTGGRVKSFEDRYGGA